MGLLLRWRARCSAAGHASRPASNSRRLLEKTGESAGWRTGRHSRRSLASAASVGEPAPGGNAWGRPSEAVQLVDTGLEQVGSGTKKILP